MSVGTTSTNIAITSRDGTAYLGSSTFKSEGRRVGFDRRVRVPLGMIYVFTEGVTNNQGLYEIYVDGETVYVSAAKAEENRPIEKLARLASRYTISGSRRFHGISMTPADAITVTISLSFEVVNAKLLLMRNVNRLNRMNNEIELAIDNALQPYLTDAVWCSPDESFLNHLINNVNPVLDNIGIRINPNVATIIRTKLNRIEDIVLECRLGEERLIDMMDGGRFESLMDTKLNNQRVKELQKNPAHGFLDINDITTFVTQITVPNGTRGSSFFDMVIQKLKVVNADVDAVRHFVSIYAGPSTYAFVDFYINELATTKNIAELEMSYGIIRNKF